MALAVPFIAERAMNLSGQAQTEAQRDAQMVMRAIARAARESTQYASGAFSIICDPGPDGVFGTADDVIGTRQFIPIGSQLDLQDTCTGQTVTLIDGVRSRVATFTLSELINDRLVQVQLVIQHEPRVGGGRIQVETMETEIHLRNGPLT
jgi:hypothetical protein